jgi:ABC-type uncharacterized transport system permease subunit
VEWFIPAVLAAMIRLSFSLIVAGLGEATAERAGVYNIGMEGYMLFGAFFGYYAALLTGHLWLGFLVAIVAGLILSLIHAYCSITLRVNQIVTGVGLWLLGIGVTSFLYRLLGGVKTVDSLPQANWGVLNDIPVLGQILFDQNALVYVGFALVVVFAYVFKRTRFGVLNAAVGENPLAVDLAGHSVTRIRYISVLICGAMSGLAGAYLSLGILGTFSENMTAGRGFIALCIVIFGKWNPWKIAGGALLFAGADALQARLQAVNAPIPFPFLLMIPYLVTLVVLVAAMRRGEAPAKLGVPYGKNED